jgi:IS1 family transposase
MARHPRLRGNHAARSSIKSRSVIVGPISETEPYPVSVRELDLAKPTKRKHTVRFDQERGKVRHGVEDAVRRSKAFRRVAAHCDKFAANFLSGAAFASALVRGGK